MRKSFIGLMAAIEFFLTCASIYCVDYKYLLSSLTLLSAVALAFMCKYEFQKVKYPIHVRVISRIIRAHVPFLGLFLAKQFLEIYFAMAISILAIATVCEWLRSYIYEIVHDRFYTNLLLGYQKDILGLEKYLRYIFGDITDEQMKVCDSSIEWFVSRDIYRYEPIRVFKLWREGLETAEMASDYAEYNDFDKSKFEDAKIPGVISINSLARFYPVPEAVKIYNTLTFGTGEKLTYTIFHQFFRQINNERINLYKSIINYSRLIDKIKRIFIAIEITLVLLFAYLFYDPSMRTFRIPTFVVFTLFPSIRKFGDSFLFIVFTNPYSQGDRIVYKEENMLVREMNILSTVCEKWNGEILVIPNHLISKSTIFNWRRTKSHTFVLDLIISSNTPQNILKRLGEELENYCIFKPHFKSLKLHIDTLEKCNKICLKLYICHNFNFQNGFFRWFRHTGFMKDLFKLLKKYNIEYHPLDLPIYIENRQVFLNELG
ncbi:Mechanosensitive ion channel protein 7 [Dictyocoela roeselum]|nr:Mechanosensitive ion channel protein 7 [Dictyocoela roeselum]